MTRPDPLPWVRALAGAVGVLVLAGLLSSCDDPSEPADPRSDVRRPEADLSADLSVSDDSVTVHYRFTNRTGAEVLVPNRLPGGTGELEETGLAYLTGDGDGVTIAQRVFPHPDTDRKDWAQAPQVGATRVAAGETVQGELEVTRPFVRRQPFGDDLGYGTIELPGSPDDVRFCLGVLTPPYPPAVSDQADVGTPVLEHSNQDAEAQYLLCSEPVALDGGSSS